MFRIIARLTVVSRVKKFLKRESHATMGNKDRRKEKKKPKQPKDTPKTSNQNKLGITRPSR
jgi:hypothetical protein